MAVPEGDPHIRMCVRIYRERVTIARILWKKNYSTFTGSWVEHGITYNKSVKPRRHQETFFFRCDEGESFRKVDGIPPLVIP